MYHTAMAVADGNVVRTWYNGTIVITYFYSHKDVTFTRFVDRSSADASRWHLQLRLQASSFKTENR